MNFLVLGPLIGGEVPTEAAGLGDTGEDGAAAGGASVEERVDAGQLEHEGTFAFTVIRQNET